MTEPGLTPDGHDPRVDLVDKVQIDLARTRKVLDTIVAQTANPVFADLPGGGTVAFESVEDGYGVFVRDWQRGDGRLVAAF